MASILKVDSIGKTSGSTQDTMAGLAKMGKVDGTEQQMHNFIEDDFNNSSMTDNGTGGFYITFTNNMSSATTFLWLTLHLLLLVQVLMMKFGCNQEQQSFNT